MIVESDPTDVVLIGALATTSAGTILEVAGNSLFRQLVTAYQIVTAPSFTATSSSASVLPYASTTAITATTASTSALIISGASGGLLKSSATGTVSVATAGVDCLSTTSGDWSGTLSTFTAAQLIALGFSTTSADVWKSNRSFFATTSNDYWKTQNDFFATTSADAWKALRSFFATTSSDYWLTQKSTDNLSQGAANKYYATSLFAAICCDDDGRLSAGHDQQILEQYTLRYPPLRQRRQPRSLKARTNTSPTRVQTPASMRPPRSGRVALL